MKRGYIQRKPKRRRAVAMRAMAKNKALGKSAVDKGPARDAGHLDMIRQCCCLVCYRGGWPWRVEAHHVRSIGPRTLGKRVSDYLAVGLCKSHHLILHAGNEGDFWRQHGIDPASWIAQFSKEGAAEIARINEQRRAA